jgi:pyrroloquinoline quinone biosynthesis protein D
MQNTAIDAQSRPALSPRARLQSDPIDGEPVLLYPEGLLKLNTTAHEVVARCDGKTTVENIIKSLGEEYELDPDTLRADVFDCLLQLQQRQLVVIAS